MVLVACFHGATAFANMVFTQPFNGVAGGYASQNDPVRGNFATVYDNFSLSEDTSIESVSWVGSQVQGNITGFTLKFWSDSAGHPDTLLQSYTVSGKANESLLGFFRGFPAFHYRYDLTTPFDVSGGSQYWISFVPDLAAPPQWYMTVGTGGDHLMYQDFGDLHLTLSEDLAFSLYAAPDGGTTVLLLGGLFAGLACTAKASKPNVGRSRS